jgi:hypothetical protein
MKKFLLILIIFAVTSLLANAQNSRFSLSAGLLTMKILGDNPNSAPIIQRDPTKINIIGGGFSQTNSGFSVKLNYDLDEIGLYTIPVGFEYIHLNIRERIPIAKNVTALLSNDAYLPAAVIGFNYKFYKFKFTNVRAYAGLELKGTFLQVGKFYREYRYDKPIDSSDVLNRDTKSAVSRFGGNFKLGFVGQIAGNVYINSFISFGIINLAPTDNNRGELLTTGIITEDKETLTATMNFGLLLEYRF